MTDVPAVLLEDLRPADVKVVAAWWAGLNDAARSEVADLWDVRRDHYFFGVVADDPAAQVPVVIGGRFVPSDSAAGWEEWHAELFDYLLCNPELVILVPPRTFHICIRHEARAALAEGRSAAEFQCPLGSETCPIQRLLSVEECGVRFLCTVIM